MESPEWPVEAACRECHHKFEADWSQEQLTCPGCEKEGPRVDYVRWRSPKLAAILAFVLGPIGVWLYQGRKNGRTSCGWFVFCMVPIAAFIGLTNAPGLSLSEPAIVALGVTAILTPAILVPLHAWRAAKKDNWEYDLDPPEAL